MRVRAFDDLTKELAGATSRRTLLKRALIGSGAVLVPLGAASEASAEKCKPLGHKCLTNVDCCSRFCDKEHGNVCSCTPSEIACAQPHGQARCVPRCASGLGPCKIDACNPTTGGCIVANAPNGTPCDDGDLCTLGDSCQSGTCQAGPLKTCPQCQKCDSATGTCVADPAKNGTGCDDGNPCTVNDTCQAGVCTPGQPKDCSDNNACTTDSCDPTTGQCVHTQIAGCVACSTAGDCPIPSNQCLRATCNGGVCGVENKPNGTACSDGNACTVNDTCQAGLCTPGPTCPGPGQVCCSTGMHAGTCKGMTGAPCTGNGQCCSNTCLPPVGGVRRCA